MKQQRMPPHFTRSVQLVPAAELQNRKAELNGKIRHRAHELFERRGAAHGHEVEDWAEAEREVRCPCNFYHLKEMTDAVVFRAELPGLFTADQLQVGVEPSRLMFSGETTVNTTYARPKDAPVEWRTMHIFEEVQLPVEVDPTRSAARVTGHELEIVMVKASETKARATSAG